MATTEETCRETVRDLRAREEARKALRLEIYGKKAEARRQEAVREAERAWDLQGGRDHAPHPGAVAQTGTPLLQSRTYTPVFLPLGGPKPMAERPHSAAAGAPAAGREGESGGGRDGPEEPAEPGARGGSSTPRPPRPPTGGGVRIKYAPLEDSTAARPRAESSPLYAVAPPGNIRPHTARAGAKGLREVGGTDGGGGNWVGSRPNTARNARGAAGVSRGLSLKSRAEEQMYIAVRRQAAELQATQDQIAGMWQAVAPG